MNTPTVRGTMIRWTCARLVIRLVVHFIASYPPSFSIVRGIEPKIPLCVERSLVNPVIIYPFVLVVL